MEEVTIDGDVDRQDGGISIIGEGGEVAMEDKIGKGDEVGKSNLLGNGECSGYQSMMCSVKRKWEVHPEVAMFDGRVVGDKG